MYKTNDTTFTVLEDQKLEKDATSRVEITSGKYAGVIFHFNKVSFDEKTYKLKYDYDIDGKPSELEIEDLSEFENLLGDMLSVIINEV